MALLAFGVRWIRWVRSDVVDADAPRFLSIAESVASGDWSAVLADDFHPLYAILVAGMHALVDDWELAGVLVSIIGGVAAVGFGAAFVRDAFGWPAAPVAGVLIALQVRHVDFTSDIQSEGTYLAMFLAAIWCGWRALSGRSSGWAVAAGAAAGLAYWIRPEGLGVVVVLASVAGFELIRGRWPLARAAAWGASLMAGAILVVAPYVILLHQETGVWTLSGKKSILALAGIDEVGKKPASLRRAPTAPLPRLKDGQTSPDRDPPGVVANTFELWRKALKSFRYEMLLLLGIGLWQLRGPPELRGRFLLILVAVYAAVLFGLLSSSGYVSRRHWLPPLTPLLGFAAVGVPVLGRLLLRLFGRRAASTGAAIAIGLVFVIVALGDSLRDVRGERHLAERRAGEWLAATGEPATLRVVATPRPYSAYYADARYLPLEPSVSTLEPVLLRERGVTHVIVGVAALSAGEWGSVLSRPGLRLVNELDEGGRRIRVLALEPRAPGEAVPTGT